MIPPGELPFDPFRCGPQLNDVSTPSAKSVASTSSRERKAASCSRHSAACSESVLIKARHIVLRERVRDPPADPVVHLGL